MNFKELESEQKLRGGYYTPLPVVEFLCRWAITPKSKTILEPSCGDGRFIEAISKVVREKGIKQRCISIEAIELLKDQAYIAREKAKHIKSKVIDVKIFCDDFLAWVKNVPMSKTWDTVLGNPPYIRYQYFDKGQREFARDIFKKADVPFSMLTNAWVPFIIASIIHLSPGGRIAMVIPSEISYIMHAQGLRELIEQELDFVRILHFREIVFEGTLQGTVLFLGVKRADRSFTQLLRRQELNHDLFFKNLENSQIDFKIQDLNNIQDLKSLDTKIDPHSSYKRKNELFGNWMLGILNKRERSLLSEIASKPEVVNFSDIANINIGIVTGANKFFCVNKETLRKYNLNKIAKPMLARSELIKGITYTLKDQKQNSSEGKSVFFLEFPDKPVSELTKQMQEYIKIGEEQDIHKRYKCRIREPWYCVPYVWVSEISLLKRCHSFPRLVLNDLRAYSTDTAYRITLKKLHANSSKEFVFSFINSYTLLLAELGGRHYAGGVLELVPSEIRALKIPLVKTRNKDFRSLDTMVRENLEINKILDFTDDVVLKAFLRLTVREMRILRGCYRRLRERRLRHGRLI